MSMNERCNVRKIVLVIFSFLANATCERISVIGWCIMFAVLALSDELNCGPVVIDVGKGKKVSHYGVKGHVEFLTSNDSERMGVLLRFET